MPLLIDGHNVIGAEVFADIRLDQVDDELRLVHRLRAWRGRYPDKIIIIFDRGITEGRSRPLSGGGVDVYFARNPTDADDLIRRRIRSRMPNLVVVTRDQALRAEAARHNVPVWQPEDLVERMTDAPAPPDASPQQDVIDTQAELEQAIDEFEQLFQQDPNPADDKYWTPPAGRPKGTPAERAKKPGKRTPASSTSRPPRSKRSKSESAVDEFERLFGERPQEGDDKYWTPPMQPRRDKRSAGSAAGLGDEERDETAANASAAAPADPADDISEFERLFGKRKREDDDKYWTPHRKPPRRPPSRRRTGEPPADERPKHEDRQGNDTQRKR